MKSRRGVNKNLAVMLGVGIGAATVFSLHNQAQALPSFSREYKVECATCHTHFPERNTFGEAFERNGFIWPGEKKPQKSEKGNEGLLLSGIPDLVPISLYARVTSTYNPENSDDRKGPDLDYGNGGSFEFFAAGNFKERIGYMAEAAFDEGEGTGNVYVKFKDPGNIPMYVKIGKFAPTLSVLTRHTAAQGYTFHNSNVLAPTGVSITSGQPGVEISKNFFGHVYAAFGLQNNKNNDNLVNNSVAGYGSVAWRVVGTDLYGNQPKVDLAAKESFLDFLTLTLGAWGISGAQHEGVSPSVDNTYDRFGLDLEAEYKALRLRMTTTWGTEEEPYRPSSTSSYLRTDGEDKDLRSYHALLEYMINSDWMVGAGYNYLDIDELRSTNFNFPQENMALSASYLVFQNVRLQGAYIHDSYTPNNINIEDGNRDRFNFNIYFSM